VSAFPDIAELVPHQRPMLALDRVVDYEPGRVRTELTLLPDNPFARDDEIDSVVTLEYMAQAVAACLGMEAYAEGAPVRVGMVIACRKMEIARSPLEVGEVLAVEARRVRGTDSLSHFEAAIRDAGGAAIATSTLTLVHGERPPEADQPGP